MFALQMKKMVITSANEYKIFINQLSKELAKLNDSIPQEIYSTIIMQASLKLERSTETIKNNLKGRIPYPDFAFKVRDTITELLNKK